MTFQPQQPFLGTTEHQNCNFAESIGAIKTLPPIYFTEIDAYNSVKGECSVSLVGHVDNVNLTAGQGITANINNAPGSTTVVSLPAQGGTAETVNVDITSLTPSTQSRNVRVENFTPGLDRLRLNVNLPIIPENVCAYLNEHVNYAQKPPQDTLAIIREGNTNVVLEIPAGERLQVQDLGGSLFSPFPPVACPPVKPPVVISK